MRKRAAAASRILKAALLIFALVDVQGCGSNETQQEKEMRASIAEQRAWLKEPSVEKYLKESQAKELQEQHEKALQEPQQRQKQTETGYFVPLKRTKKRKQEISDCLEAVDNTFNDAVRSKGRYVPGKGYVLSDSDAEQLHGWRKQARANCDPDTGKPLLLDLYNMLTE